MFKKLRKNEKGFTLAELLIVVAIIGVLVAISIPIFTSQLEKAREATDMANIRSAYAEVVAAGLTDPDTDHTATVPLKQQKSGWQTSGLNIAGVNLSAITSTGNVDVIYHHAADNNDAYVTISNQRVDGTSIS